MTAYLDTSSLVKVYVDEAGSDEVRHLFERTTTAATSVVAYAETRAALAGLRRSGALSSVALTNAKRQLESDWSALVTITADDELCRAAGRLAEQHALCGFDSIHLASYLEVVRRSPGPVTFSSFDERLVRAVAAAMRTARARRRPSH